MAHAPGRSRPRLSNPWWGLTVVCLGTTMTLLNLTQTVTVIGPIEQALGASPAEVVWIASAYAMAVASLVMSTGSIGDRFGRRRVFTLGVAVFGAGSLVSYLAGSPTMVIIGQAIAGVGGAMVIPNSLAIVTHAFDDAHKRSGAVAIWATLAGVGLAIGPISAGVLLEAFAWNSVFLVVVILAVVLIGVTPLLVPESRRPGRRLDLPGLGLAVVAVAALNYAVIEGGNDGFSAPQIIAGFVIAAAALVAFVTVEHRSQSPMLSLRLFRSPTFSAANAAALMVQYAFVGIAVAEVLWFEEVKGDSILFTGVQLLPLMGMFVVTSIPAGRLARRAGFKVTVSLGLALIAVSSLLLTTQDLGTSAAVTAVLLAVLGVGCGLSLPTTVAAAVISVPHADGGVASGSVNMFRQIGGALGASITGTIITTGLASRLPGQLTSHGVPAAVQPAVARAVIAGQAPGGAPASLLPGIRAAAGGAFADAMHIALLTVGIGAVVLLAVALVFIAANPHHAVAAAAPAAPAPEVADAGAPAPDHAVG
jgi:EmrB/QacA subfamily drug resistance transporter